LQFPMESIHSAAGKTLVLLYNNARGGPLKVSLALGQAIRGALAT
jgi:hypothetical protein